MSTLVYPSRLSIFEGTTVSSPERENPGVFDVIGRWVQVSPPLVPSPEGRRLAFEIQRATGWSERAMARVFGTTHPTVGKLLDGQGVNPDLAQRVFRVHEVISRVHEVTGRDRHATARILESPGSDGESAVGFLAQEEYAEAYLTALDALRPRQRGMLVGIRPAAAGRANIPLADEE